MSFKNSKIKESLNDDGFIYLKSCIDINLIYKIKLSFVKTLSQFSNSQIEDSYSIEEIDTIFETLFAEITNKSLSLRENIFKIFSQNMAILNLQSQKKISNAIFDSGVTIPTLSAFGVIAMEPNRDRFLFHPHQDLHKHYSYRTLNLWVPLTTGENIGGMAIAKGQHKLGPMKHSVAIDGQLELKENQYDRSNVAMLEDVPVGDAILFDTQAVHWSILNKSNVTRWTAYISISSGSDLPHLANQLMSFNPENFIDTRSNEERIKEAVSKKSNQ